MNIDDGLRAIGVDEAGRGPLAGPVAVAVVKILDPAAVQLFFTDKIRDSKKMTEKRRKEVFEGIREAASRKQLVFAAALVAAHSIDELGITASCTAGVGGVLKRLDIRFDEEVTLDGRLYAPTHFTKQVSIDKGDETHPAIALASVVAKVTRDERMKELGREYPVYGFEVHKGYGTKAHYDALLRHGLSPEHRRTFLKKFLTTRQNPHG